MKNIVDSICDGFIARVMKASSFSFARIIESNRKIHYIVYTNGLTILGAFIFIPIHAVFHFYTALIVNIVFSVLCISILTDFWLRSNLKQTIWLTAIIPSFYAVALFWALEGQHQIGAYMIIPAGFVFLLLGARFGVMFGVFYCSVVVGSIVWRIALQDVQWYEFNLSSVSLVMFTGALILAFFWGYTGENVRRRTLQMVENVADTDVLTVAVSRRSFFEILNDACQDIIYSQKPAAILMFDVDHFKLINDNFGHDAGDHLLVELVGLVKSQVRPYDVVGRLGGDEFAVLLRDVTSEEAMRKAENIRRLVSQYDFASSQGKNFTVTISIGVAFLTQNGKLTADELYKIADIQLYHAKQTGKNRVSANFEG